MFPITCPLPTALTAITQTTCPFRLDQIVRIFFQKRQTVATFDDETDLKTLATWQALLAISDATKIVATPLFAGFTIPQSEALTQGGNDNSTINGIRDYMGEGTVTAAGEFSDITPASKVSLKNLTQFSLANAVGLTNLTAYFVGKTGTDMWYAENFFGEEVYNFRIGSLGTEGFNSKTKNGFSIDLPQDWDDSLKHVTLNFNALTQLP